MQKKAMQSAKLPTLAVKSGDPGVLRKSGEHLLRKQSCIGKETKKRLFDCLLPLASSLFAGRVPKSTPHNIIWDVEQTNSKVEEWMATPGGVTTCATVERMLQSLGAPTSKRKVVTTSTRMVAELVYELCSILPAHCASNKTPLVVDEVVKPTANASSQTYVNAPFGFDPGLKDGTTGMDGISELYPQRLCTALTCSMLHKAMTQRAEADGRVGWLVTLRDEIFRAIYADYMADFPAQRVYSSRGPDPKGPTSRPLSAKSASKHSGGAASTPSVPLATSTTNPPGTRLPQLNTGSLTGNSSARSDGSFSSFLRLTPYYERCNMLRTEVRRLVKQRQVYQAQEDNARLLNEKRQTVIMRTAKRWQALLLKTVFRHWMLIAKHRINQREKLKRYFSGIFSLSKPKAFALWRRWLNDSKLKRALEQTDQDEDSLTIVESELAASMQTKRELQLELKVTKKEVRDTQGRYVRLADEILGQRVEETVELNRRLASTLVTTGNRIIEALQKKLEKIMASPELSKLSEMFYSTGDNPMHLHEDTNRRAMMAEAQLRRRLLRVERERIALIHRHQRLRTKRHKRLLFKKKKEAEKEARGRYEDNIRAQQANGSPVVSSSKELAELTQRAIFKVKRELQAKLEEKNKEVEEKGKQLALEQRKTRKRLMARIEAQWRHEQIERAKLSVTESHMEAAVKALRRVQPRTKDQLGVGSTMSVLGADEVVLRWVQMHVSNTLFRHKPFKRRCLNFGEDLRDGKIMYVLVKHLLENSPAAAVTSYTRDSQGKVLRGPEQRIKVEGNPIGGSCSVDAEDLLRAKLLLRKPDELLRTKNMDANNPHHLLTGNELEFEVDPAALWQGLEKSVSKMRPPCAGFTTQQHVLSGQQGSFCNAAFLVRHMLAHPTLGTQRITFRKTDPKDLDEMLEAQKNLTAMSTSHDPGHLDDLKQQQQQEQAPPRTPQTEVFVDPTVAKDDGDAEEAQPIEEDSAAIATKKKAALNLSRNVAYILKKIALVQKFQIDQVHLAAVHADADPNATLPLSAVLTAPPPAPAPAATDPAEEKSEESKEQTGGEDGKEAKDDAADKAEEKEGKEEGDEEDAELERWDEGRLPLDDKESLLLQFFEMRRNWRDEVAKLPHYQSWDKWVKFYLSLEKKKDLSKLLERLAGVVKGFGAFDKKLAPFYKRGKRAMLIWGELFQKLSKFLWQLMSAKASLEVEMPYQPQPLDGQTEEDDRMYNTLIGMGAMPDPKRKRKKRQDNSEEEGSDAEVDPDAPEGEGAEAEAAEAEEEEEEEEEEESSEDDTPRVAPPMPPELRLKLVPPPSVAEKYANFRLVDYRSRLEQYQFTRLRTKVLAGLLLEAEKGYTLHVERNGITMLDKLRVIRAVLQKHYGKLANVFHYYSRSDDDTSEDNAAVCSFGEWKNFVRDCRLMKRAKKKKGSAPQAKEVEKVTRYKLDPGPGEDLAITMSRPKFLETVYQDSDWTPVVAVVTDSADARDELEQSVKDSPRPSLAGGAEDADDDAEEDDDSEEEDMDDEDEYFDDDDPDAEEEEQDDEAEDSDDSSDGEPSSDEDEPEKPPGRDASEFIEMIIRSSLWLGDQNLKPYLRLEDFLVNKIFPNACTINLDDIRGEMGLDPVQAVFQQHRRKLQKIFYHYALSAEMVGGAAGDATVLLDSAESSVNLNGWLQLVMDSKILTQPMDVPNSFPIQSANSVFQQVQMAEDGVGGTSVGGGTSEMIWIEFVEAIAVTACYLYRNPYIPLQTKLEDFLTHVLIPNQKKFALKRKH